MRRFRLGACAAAILLSAGLAHAQLGVGTAFTYQGQLNVSGALANGSYDLQFKLFDAATVGNQIGPTIGNSGVSITKGLFTQTLDFAAGAFNGSARWLEISVRPAGQGSFTTLTPRQPMTPAPYALGLALPYSGTQATANTLLNLVETAPTNAGAIAGTVLSGTGTAVYGQASNTGTGVWGYHLGTSGSAGYFRNENQGNTSAAVRAETAGSGSAGDFQVQSAGDSAPALNAATTGTGHAGFFSVNNAANATAALMAVTNSTGDGVTGVTTGTGRAGNFAVLNASSGASALEASTTGFGYAGKFTGPVRVTGNLDAGNVTTAYTTGGQHRAAPIAFGQFSITQASTTTSNSSGNVTVTYMGNDVYRVNVLGAVNPTTWNVVANLAYGSPDNPGVTYTLRVGTPDAGGHILFYAPCDSNCGGFGTLPTVNYVVYAP